MNDASAGHALPLPELPARFTVLGELGRGGQGVVLRAHDAVLDAQVALKVLKPALASDAQFVERMRREALLVRRVVHAGICRVHDLQSTPTATFLVMDVVEGRALSELLADGALDVNEATRITLAATHAIAAAHAAGVIHRDLKPQNLLVQPDGHVVVVDFGVATAADLPKLTEVDTFVGTRAYVAPEIWLGAPATRLADVYALGVILYQALTGTTPYGDMDSSAVPTVMPPSERRTDIPHWLDAVVLRAMAPLPRDRFPSARAFADALQHTPLERAFAQHTLELPASRRRRWRVAAGAVVVAIGALGYVATRVAADAGVSVRDTQDAGRRVAVASSADAGFTAVVAVDAGLTVVVDAAAAVDADAAAAVGTDAAHARRNTVAGKRKAAQLAVARACRARGVRDGDDNDVDRALRSLRRARTADAVSAAQNQALTALRAFKATTVFLDRKLRRLNGQFANLDADAKAKVAPQLSRASAFIGAGRYDDANRALNAGFDAVPQ